MQRLWSQCARPLGFHGVPIVTSSRCSHAKPFSLCDLIFGFLVPIGTSHAQSTNTITPFARTVRLLDWHDVIGGMWYRQLNRRAPAE